MNVSVALTTLLLLVISSSLVAAPTAHSQKTLDDCAKELASKSGGWCELKVSDQHPSISAVWPDRSVLGSAWGNTGPASVLIAWNGAGFDAKRKTFYFFGGGHGDYGGNEVYAFSLPEGKWQRLTDPSPLDHYYLLEKAGKLCQIPDIRKVPFPAHTYGGIIYKDDYLLVNASALGTIGCVAANKAEVPAAKRLTSGGIYAFHLPTRQWSKVSEEKYHYPRFTLINNELFVGDLNTLYYSDFKAGTLTLFQRFTRHANAGDGIAYFDPGRNLIWEVTDTYLWSKGARLGLTQSKTVMQVPHGKSMQANNNGELISWNGTSLITSYSPEEDQWRIYDWKSQGGPQDGDSRVYSKWQYLPDYDLFVGLSKHTTGVWVYKHPTDIQWKTLKGSSPQAYINRAKSGTSVQIPAGTYSRGFTINKPLTVNMQGVELLQPIGRKGYVIVQGGPITVENFELTHPPGCGSNCAGFRLEKSPVVTLRNGIIAHQENGILSGNDGGDIRLENITISDTGGGGRFGQQHSIYIGAADTLYADTIRVNAHHNGGHLLNPGQPLIPSLIARWMVSTVGIHAFSTFPVAATSPLIAAN